MREVFVRSLPQAVLLGLALLFAVPCGAFETHQFTEDFSTTAYCDTSETTLDWNTTLGEIRLYDFVPEVVGSQSAFLYSRGIEVSGNYAFVACRNMFQVFDVEDPSAPWSIVNVGLDDYGYGIDVDGDRAYVATISAGLTIIDVEDPGWPVELQVLNTPGHAYDVVADGDYAYVADETYGLQVVDIGDSVASIVGTCDTPGQALGVDVYQDCAYVAAYSAGLQAVWVQDPANPFIDSSLSLPTNAWGVDVEGDYAYVAGADGGLYVVSVRTFPMDLVGTCDTPGFAYEVKTEGDYAYVADREGIQVIDVSDPANPVLVHGCDITGTVRALDVAGEHAYVTDSLYGIQIIDICDDMAEPQFVAAEALDDVSYFSDACVLGDHAYVTGGLNLYHLDISDPENPQIEAQTACPTVLTGVAANEDFIYVGTLDTGILVFDVGLYELQWQSSEYFEVRDLVLEGDYLYVAGVDAGLLVYDISTNGVMTNIGSYDPGVSVYNVVVDGNLAYLACYDVLRVVDVTDPASPYLLGATSPEWWCPYDIVISGKHVYCSGGSGVMVYDVYNPTNPHFAGWTGTVPMSSGAVAVSGDRVYQEGDGYFIIWDVTDPSEPDMVTYSRVSELGYDSLYSMHVAGDYAFAVRESGGFAVYHVRQRFVDSERNFAKSLSITGSGADIVRASVTTAQSDSILWMLSADDGTSWEQAQANAGWMTLANPGTTLRWSSTHEYLGGPNPACSSLTIDWLYAKGVVEDVDDVEEDQGGWVRSRFTRSGHDFADAATPIVDYYIWSRVDEGLAAAVAAGGHLLDAARRVPNDRARGAMISVPHMESAELREYEGRVFATQGSERADTFPPGTWEVVAGVPALQQDEYLARVPTTGDSTAAGIEWTVLCVTAHTTDPTEWFCSEPDSGYSTDDIAPGVPGGLAVEYNSPAGGNQLSWGECSEDDFQYFRIYRGDSEDFVPSPELLVHSTAELYWLDSEGTGWDHYKVTAMDHAGNESEPASPSETTGADGGTWPDRLVFRTATPNPTSSATLLRYDVPAGGADVTLSIYNLSGRLVRRLVEAPQPEGGASVLWDGRDDAGVSAASGIYFCLLSDHAGNESVLKLALIR
jgi:hypothetical protein